MRRSPLAVLLAASLAVLLGLAGCGDDPDDTAPGPDTRRPDKVAGIPTDTGTHKQKLDVGTLGHREYLVHVPPRVTDGDWKDGEPADPPPLLLALHGGLANMDKMRDLTGYDAISDKKGFVVAYPNGFMTTWNAGDCCGAAKIGGIDDVGFLTKLIGKLTDAGLADPDRVYVTGFSNGAGMAYRMACERPGKVAGIGVVEGALVTECDPRSPVSAMIVHGTADRSVPLNGGSRRDFNDGRPFPPVSQAVRFWRERAGLPATGQTIKGLDGGSGCSTTGKGPKGFEVAFCKVRGGTHEWHDGTSALLWDFLEGHRRPD